MKFTGSGTISSSQAGLSLQVSSYTKFHLFQNLPQKILFSWATLILKFFASKTPQLKCRMEMSYGRFETGYLSDTDLFFRL